METAYKSFLTRGQRKQDGKQKKNYTKLFCFDIRFKFGYN